MSEQNTAFDYIIVISIHFFGSKLCHTLKESVNISMNSFELRLKVEICWNEKSSERWFSRVLPSRGKCMAQSVTATERTNAESAITDTFRCRFGRLSTRLDSTHIQNFVTIFTLWFTHSLTRRVLSSALLWSPLSGLSASASLSGSAVLTEISSPYSRLQNSLFII